MKKYIALLVLVVLLCVGIASATVSKHPTEPGTSRAIFITGLSSDVKPTNVSDNSFYYATDTHILYIYNHSVDWVACYAGSGSSDITTVGTIVSGVWHGTAIADGYISSAATWNAKLSYAEVISALTTTPLGYVSGGTGTNVDLFSGGVTTTCTGTSVTLIIANGIITSATCTP